MLAFVLDTFEKDLLARWSLFKKAALPSTFLFPHTPPYACHNYV